MARRATRTAATAATAADAPDVTTGTKPAPAAEEEAQAKTAEEGPIPEPTAEEWEKRRAELLAKVPPEEKRPPNIYARLAQILGLVGTVQKRGYNTFHRYRYVLESDLVEAIRPLLAEYGIWLEHGVIFSPSDGIVGHERRTQVLKDRDKNIVGEQESLTVLNLGFQFVWWNPESSEIERTEQQLWIGYGDDTGDKGAYKAMTGGEKYFLMKQFLVATGDDPERDENTDQRAAARQGAGRAPVRVESSGRQGGRAQPQPGGRQQEGSQPQIREALALMKQLGVTKTGDAFALLERMIPGLTRPETDDPAEALAATFAAMKPEVAGKLVADLRAAVEAGSAPEKAEAETAATTDEEAAADGWKNEDGPTEGEEAATAGEAAPEPADEDLEAGSYS